MVLLARKDEEGNTQALYDHLHGAGRLASGFEDEFADISRTAAVLHDVGKVAQQFQTYLLSDDGHRGDVQHARQGAFVVNDFFESKGEIEEIAKEILELAISKHHGGLPDCIDESGNRAFLLGFTESDKSNEKYAYQEIKRGLNGLALDLQSNFRGSAEDIACFLKKIKSLRLSKDSIYFYLGLLVKLIYSRLVDADRTDAACFETRKQYRPNAVDWQNLISRLDKSMRSFDSSSEINRIRHQINEQCCLAGARETGIYRLSIPTGGGKTLASLNFALHHALKTGKRRIIYVIPYSEVLPRERAPSSFLVQRNRWEGPLSQYRIRCLISYSTSIVGAVLRRRACTCSSLQNGKVVTPSLKLFSSVCRSIASARLLRIMAWS